MSKDYDEMVASELIDVLLDFIAVSADLAKSISRSITRGNIRKGGNANGHSQRTGYGDQRLAQRRDYCP